MSLGEPRKLGVKLLVFLIKHLKITAKLCAPSLTLFGHRNVAKEDSWHLLKEEEIEIDNQLKILNKPYLKTFKDKNGDNYDCVDMYKQPTFDHPLLKNHSDQIRLNLQARQWNATSRATKLSNLRFNECPNGTVLIKRTKKEDLIRAKNKKYVHFFHPKNTKEVINNDGKTFYAMETFDYGERSEIFYGAVAEMGVCRHNNLKDKQSTTAQMLLIKGDGGPQDHINAVQFGWQIAPSVYGNSNTNLFALYTSNGYKTSCLNYECGAFVQVSKKVTLGQPIPDNVATINMFASKVLETGDWSLYYKLGNDYEEVGFWPKKLFNNMDDVKLFEVGGIVFSPFNTPSPPMGNGVLPTDESPGVGATIDHVSFRSQSGFYVAPEESMQSQHETATNYYALSNSKYEGNGFKFEYGGPGGSTGP